MRTSLIRVSLLIAMSLAVQSLVALPKFASRTGAKCQSCHVNPTGKGMRNEFGRTFGQDDIVLPTFKEQTDIEEYSTNLTPNLSFGGDFRTLFFYNQRADVPADNNVSSFFQMQGDLYFDIRLNKKFSIYLDKGLYSGFEVFGIAKVLPLNGYIKAGKFMPAYGTRVDDHNYFIRGGPFGGGPFAGLFPGGFPYPTGLLFGERSEDTGIELGVSPGIFTANVGVFNGTPGSGLSGVSGTKTKAIALRGDATFKFSGLNFNIGGSLYNAPSVDRTSTFYGAFGSVTAFERLTLNSEVDYVQLLYAGRTKVGVIVWNELNYMVRQGIDLKLGYEYYDPDNVVANGSFSRITVGAELFLLSGVEVRPLYKINLETHSEVSNNEFQLLLHFYF